MVGVVEWQPDGTPRSLLYGDLYRSRGTDGLGGLAQARHVFLRGCGLLPDDGQPPAWAGAARWHVLENGFGLGLNFLATWQVWRDDPSAPPALFYTGIEAHPCNAEDIVRSAAPFAPLQPLAARLAAAWRGLLPGVHRWTWTDAGPDGAPRTLHLTLCVGEAARWLPALDAPVDSVFLDGFAPARNPAMWTPEVLRAAVRACRRGARLATWSVARAVRDGLAAVGCRVSKAAGLPPKRECLRAVFDPPWEPRRPLRAPLPWGERAGHAAVVGGGLAGAAAAYSLARCGWRVTVLDRAAEPAAGASGLPVGLLAPHTSPDDAPLSRLTRAGLALARQRVQALLVEGLDWGASGVLEHRVEDKHALPPAEQWQPWGEDWSRPATPSERAAASLPPEASALWHAAGAWLRPARLVQAQLAAADAAWRGGAEVTALLPMPSGGWRLLGIADAPLLEADLVVLAAGPATRALLRTLGADVPLHALRGQVAWAPMADLPPHIGAALPAWPVNGHGSLVAGVPAGPQGEPIWCMGSTFVRGRTDTVPTAEEHAANFAKLQRLLPKIANQLAPHWPQAQAWAGVRCTLPDRFPAVGAVDPQRLPGLHILTGLGARGLTLSALTGEVLAAELHGEPWPLESVLAEKLLARRWSVPATSIEPASAG
ncbi:tRNA 5-methylaminomethyl-2-thiouridine biosynthesis bifunctional protein MnmC [Tepidimonas alkaliphilus]|uniref:tRNA 5-methylaminomethyl-2-thiouridine biosynthesis bifunctional protein MnmC n=1 Tax=Tepidimonas alkaliphilus TaxID=2588942 RepID=A0A554WDE0_9BURK|nr:FAD-dependent 5-carboxymethylaminomethyl-2-thiouridine(34) oxidoreductase MnmC [Tepidimonas alkaliphilus]TSE21586.1 tRNA 5-methylaminomethyl-2-thiouridine biosynthesis bifunctional protein MnmC [Tepidimonas alkaliphilus]